MVDGLFNRHRDFDHASRVRRGFKRINYVVFFGFLHLVGLLLLLRSAQALSGLKEVLPTRGTTHTKTAASVLTRTTTESSEPTTTARSSSSSTRPTPVDRSLVTVISEDVWRKAASDHRKDIQDLLEPGLVDLDHPMMRPVRKYFLVDGDGDNDDGDDDGDGDHSRTSKMMTMLDPKHPIYNFLVEYYGLKGLKGPKRLARWSPSIGLFFWDDENDGDNNENASSQPVLAIPKVRKIKSLNDYHMAASAYIDPGIPKIAPTGTDEADRGIFLEGATPDDLALTLYLQGAEWIDPSNHESVGDGSCVDDFLYNGMKAGILYRPIRYYDYEAVGSATVEKTPPNNDIQFLHKKASSFTWYKSILQTTLANEAILHCYGLHEWAMQYHPEGAPPPPSGKYQSHLPLRASREVINSTVERKGLRCTHVDALRFFAPSAGPLNFHGASLERTDQLELEQPGCVHAHMDLLKIALRVKPYCDPALLVEILGIALEARSLDVGASPYDCSEYSVDNKGSPIPIIPVETPEGRATYKAQQTELMERAEGVRLRLLANYEAFGALAFCSDQLESATSNPNDEQFAKAEPGGMPWRHNLIDRPDAQNQQKEELLTRGEAK